MKNKIETSILGFPLTLIIDEAGYLTGCMTEEGGSYPLLDFESARIFVAHGVYQKT